MEPQLAARKARADGVAQRQVFCVGRFFAVGDGCRVAPSGNPFRERFWHGEKIDKYGGRGGGIIAGIKNIFGANYLLLFP